MIEAPARFGRSLPGKSRRSAIGDYCEQLGLLLERRHTERALVAAKKQAESAAQLSQAAMRNAQAAEQAKTKFLGNMMHELRTPLNAIIGFSEVIQSAPRQSDAGDYAKYIHDAGKNLLEILNGVLDLARIDAGRLSLDEQIVPVEEIIRAAVKAVRPAADAKSLSLDCTAIRSPAVNLDPIRMKQVLTNILSNAIKFTDEGGTVQISSDLDPHGALSIRVRDTGVGIPAGLLDTVIEPFAQVEEHLTRQTGGIGLGLPIARALVRLHGGELTLASEIGIGTAVLIRLPAERVIATGEPHPGAKSEMPLLPEGMSAEANSLPWRP